MSELITVIVPVYKTEQYLRRCVESLQAQTYEELEILLVDDGSPDGSGAICDALADEDPRIRVIHKANGGLSSARNAGLDAINGEYVCFVDSDDYVETDYVETLYNLLTEADADLAKIDYAEVTGDEYSSPAQKAEVQVYRGEEVERAYLELKVDSACVFLYKRSLIGESRFLPGRTSEDIPFNFELFQKAAVFVYAPLKKYYYYYNPGSISNGPLDRNMMNYLHFREEIYRFYLEKKNPELSLLAEAIYARAAMGLMARMALYGIEAGMDEAEYKKCLRSAFMPHQKVYFKDPHTPFSRKVLAVLVFYFYPITKVLKRMIK